MVKRAEQQGSHAKYARLNADGTYELIEGGEATKRQALQVLADWVVPVLFILAIPIVVAFYITDRNAKDLLYKNQISACDRGNDLRKALAANEQALDAFLADAQATRTQQGKVYRIQGDIAQAVINEQAAANYKATRAQLQSIETVDCLSTIKHR